MTDVNDLLLRSIPFIAYAYSSGVVGAEELGREIEAALGAVSPPPVSSDAGGDQPGACAPVPLPEPTTHVYFCGALRAVYSPGRLRAYGEACAAHWRDIALRATDQAQQLKIAMKSAERERDEWKTRAEAAEAKIADMEGATPQRRA
jgi:hypothetical protein